MKGTQVMSPEGMAKGRHHHIGCVDTSICVTDCNGTTGSQDGLWDTQERFLSLQWIKGAEGQTGGRGL